MISSLLLLPVFLAASNYANNIPDELKEFMAYEPDRNVPESFYSGLDENGLPLPDQPEDDFVPDPVLTEQMRQLLKPQNEQQITAASLVTDNSDEEESGEIFGYDARLPADFCTGEGAVDTIEEPMGENTADLQALEKGSNFLNAKQTSK